MCYQTQFFFQLPVRWFWFKRCLSLPMVLVGICCTGGPALPVKVSAYWEPTVVDMPLLVRLSFFWSFSSNWDTFNLGLMEVLASSAAGVAALAMDT